MIYERRRFLFGYDGRLRLNSGLYGGLEFRNHNETEVASSRNESTVDFLSRDSHVMVTY